MIIGVINKPDDVKLPVMPEIIKKLREQNIEVWLPSGAGDASMLSDEALAEAGGEIKDRQEIISSSDILLSTSPVTDAGFKEGAILVAPFAPFQHPEVTNPFLKDKLTVFSLDMIPRTTRAQSMDILSSMASIAGYKAVLLAAEKLPRYFPMLTTAAGSIPPAKVLIMGAGVAGLQAIATAKRLGAVVEAFDTRSAVKEEVQSLGAKFIEVEGARDDAAAGGYAVEQSEEYKQKQAAMIAEHIKKSDVVITTAQLRGKPAPLLVTEEMLKTMRRGSVVVDLAASTGGNCAFSENNKSITKYGVTIMGYSSLENLAPVHVSELYAKNINNFLQLFIQEGNISINWEDDILQGACIVKEGEDIYNQK